MEETGGVLVDTCVFVSKKVEALLRFDEPLYVTPTVVLEYLNWAVESRNMALAKGRVERAEGYSRLIRVFPALLQELGVEVVGQELSPGDVEEAVSLVVERGVDPGDAVNAVTAKKRGFKVVTLDRDWRRLEDYAEKVYIL